MTAGEGAFEPFEVEGAGWRPRGVRAGGGANKAATSNGLHRNRLNGVRTRRW